MNPSRVRLRSRFSLFALATITLGLVVHFHGAALGPTARDISGDALWAMMIYWLVALLRPATSSLQRALGAYLVCVAVEFSQLIHIPALDALRAHTLRHLILGADFDVRDLVAYAVGIVAAIVLEKIGDRR